MKKFIAVILLILVTLLLIACGGKSQGTPSSQTPPQAEYHKITPQQAKSRIDSGDPVVVVDVRTLEEYKESHIENAMLIPNETIGSTKPEPLPDLNAEILIYCRSGNRSAQAAQKLVRMGYQKVYDFGGIKDWPYDTVSSAS